MKPHSLEELKQNLTDYLCKRENYEQKDLRFVISPYRISPLGAHIDHQGGPVLGMTISTYTVIAFIPNNTKRIRLYSMNYPGVVEFGIENIKTPRNDDWGRYALGAAKVMSKFTKIEHGFTGALAGTLPASGLSSSASVGLAYLYALADVNGIDVSAKDYVELDRLIENDYLKLNNGILDQSSIVYGEKDALLHIDTVTGNVTPHLKPRNISDFKILITYSGIARALTSTGFNDRVEECGKAAGFLALLGNQKPANIFSQIPDEIYKTKGEKLPPELKKRADHYFTEKERVAEGIRAWDAGDIKEFGRLMNKSCESTIRNYDGGSPELELLQGEIAKREDVYGCNINGGGYGGCTVAFTKSELGEDAAEGVISSYIDRYPDKGNSALAFFVDFENGVRVE